MWGCGEAGGCQSLERKHLSKLGLTSVILVGGKSRRLGTNKALVEVGGRTILERVVGRLQPLSEESVLVVNTEAEVAQYERLGTWRIAVDVYPDGGSLGGLYTGLSVAETSHCLVVACDMPFLSGDLLAYMILGADQYDVVMPRNDGLLEPLHAIYGVSCLAPIRALLRSGDRKIINIVNFLPEVKVRYVEREEIERLDPRFLSFFNVNTRDDLVLAGRLAAEVD